MNKEEATKALIETLIQNIDQMAYDDYHIHLGVDRQAFAKVWENGDQKRTYLSINCYTLTRRFKGSYKCGYVDMVTGQYVVGRYDDVNAQKMEWIGR